MKSFETVKQCKLENEFTSSKENITKIIGWNFNKSVANITGLVALLDDAEIADPDYKIICNYLSVEAKNLRLLVHDICV